MKGLVRTLFVSALLLFGLFGAFTASPAAGNSPAPLQLGLGDSWAYGFGAKVPSEGGYVAQLHEALKEDFKCLSGPDEGLSPGACRHLELLNLAIPGATTKEPDPDGTLIANELPRAIQELQSRSFNDDPRDDVEVVTLHTGGNDVTNPILAACLGGLTATCVGTIQDELGHYDADLNEALSTLRGAAADARIVIGTYDNGIANCNLGAVPGAVQLADIVLEGLPGVVPRGLHDIMRDVAAAHSVQVADVYGDLDSPDDWFSSQQPLGQKTDCLHPDDTGYGKVTDAFLEALGLAESG
jgi:lysophospholipase L1-like esterase